jgi:hypothetical protein
MFAQRGKAAQFTIDAVADNGTKITGTLACSAFMRPEEQTAAVPPPVRPPDHATERRSSTLGNRRCLDASRAPS